jgi:protein-cysteine N-palmitoyltransferase HHAT
VVQDNSDSQYSSFRDNIPYMAIVVLAHPLLRRVYNAVFPLPSPRPSPVPAVKAETTTQEAPSSAHDHFRQRTSFDLYFALIFLALLHGFSALKILLILYINFKLATKLPKEYIPATTWIFNVGILFVNEFCHGYHYASIAKIVFSLTSSASNWGTSLDNYGGLIPRWEILFNFTILRLISFNIDYCWSLDRSRSSSPIEVCLSAFFFPNEQLPN